MNGIGVDTLCGKLGGEGWMWLVYRRTGGYGNAFSEEDELRGRDEGDR